MFKFIKDFLKRLEEANSKTFGDGKLDCCGLNKPSNVSKKADNKNK